MTSFFNFRTECAYKYDQDIYELFMDSFDNIPLSCVVNGRFLAVHGGISPDLKNVSYFSNRAPILTNPNRLRI
jgi:serine/threonine-protein phosphatase 2B catalytic subunit